jgi:hypothetical protein
LSRQHLAELTVELAEPWTAAHQAALEDQSDLGIPELPV